MINIGNLELYGIIYKVKNKINNKYYIGQTTREFNIRYNAKGVGVERIYNYLLNLKKRNKRHNEHLLNSMINYGIENFEICIYFDVAFSKNELNTKEKTWIQIFDSFKNGYNNCEGGGSTTGYSHSEETKNKIKETRILNGCNEPYRNCMYGKTHTLEARDKISKVHKGKKISLKQIEILKKSKGDKNNNSKSIICLNTKEIFTCMKYACSKYSIDNSSLSKTCKYEKRKSCGCDEFGNKLLWMYLNDYNYMIENNLSYKEMIKIIKEKYKGID